MSFFTIPEHKTLDEIYRDKQIYNEVMFCKKTAVKAEAWYTSFFDGPQTIITYFHDDGTRCEYGVIIKGNIFGLPEDARQDLPLTSGSASSASASSDLVAASSDLVTAFDIVAINHDGSIGKTLVETKDIPPVTVDYLFNEILLLSDPGGSFQLLVSLLDDDTIAKGTRFNDLFDTGGGNDVIKAKAGDDTVYKWKAGDLTYKGGDGSDALVFEPYDGDVPNPPSGAVVNLKTGTGANPFGGTLKLKDVENVTGSFLLDNNLTGDDSDNFLRGGTGVDQLRGVKGDDTIYVKYWTSDAARPMLADGGKGIDALSAELSDSGGAPFEGSGFEIVFINILDLSDPSQSTGTFHGGTFTGFEIIEAFGSDIHRFDFRGSDNGESVHAGAGDDILDGRGGKDVLSGGFGLDTLTGGAGKDTFFFDGFPSTFSTDMITDFSGDLIHIDNDTFFEVTGKKKDGTGKLLADQFFAGSAAHDGDDRIIYDQSSGKLFYDPDGTGASVAVHLATLTGNPALAASQIFVV